MVSPLGVVPKRGTDKFRLTVNMRYVTKHLGKKAFKFEGLKDLADLAERGDYAVSYDLMSGYYHVGLFQASRTYVGFEWGGVRHQEYCHLVVTSMAVIMFGAMCRYDDASGLRWRNIRFVEDGRGFEITFEKRKNAQYRQGNKVLVASCPGAVVCPMRLLRQLRVYTGGSEELHVFREFNGRLVAKNPGSTTPGPDKIPYDHMLRFMGLWFSGVLGTSVALFKKQWATQSERSGSASAAANAGILAEIWGQHGIGSPWRPRRCTGRATQSHCSQCRGRR